MEAMILGSNPEEDAELEAELLALQDSPKKNVKGVAAMGKYMNRLFKAGCVLITVYISLLVNFKLYMVI